MPSESVLHFTKRTRISHLVRDKGLILNEDCRQYSLEIVPICAEQKGLAVRLQTEFSKPDRQPDVLGFLQPQLRGRERHSLSAGLHVRQLQMVGLQFDMFPTQLVDFREPVSTDNRISKS